MAANRKAQFMEGANLSTPSGGAPFLINGLRESRAMRMENFEP